MVIAVVQHTDTAESVKTLVLRGVFAALESSDTPTVLQILQDHKELLLDPLDDHMLFCEVLYASIKKPNPSVVQYLMNLPVIFDISFFEYCGHTPISLVVEEGPSTLLPFLINKTDHNFALHMAHKFGLQKTVQFLLSHCTFKPRFLRFLGL